MLKLADRLRGLRGTESQTAFAARFGLKQAIYSHYETGRKKPSLEVLVDMAVKLGATTDYLLGLSDEPPRKAAPSIKTGDNSPVAIGANARASSRTTVATPGEMPACSKCPYKKRWEKIESMK